MRHFDLDCSNVKYSEDHLFQKCWVILVSNRQRSQWRRSSGTVGCRIAVNAFPIRKCPGVKTQGSSRLLDNTHSGLENCWDRWTREGTNARKTGSGTTRKTTRREDRRIVRQAPVDLTVTRSTIRADVGAAIVPQTISRYLAEANLKSKRPFRALPLTSEHRQLRLQWCQARSMWNVTDWQKVVFSDESRFVLGTDDNRVQV
ncbi:transposable element Tc1 transposase [Trichonephila clavipes]|nr:transposable element Tc1 transposase [Trichonephila clavipes]